MKQLCSFLILCTAVLPLVQAAGSPGHLEKLYILNSGSDDMTVVDVATNKIIGSVTVGARPHGIAAPKSQKLLYVATEGEDHGLTIVDTVQDKAIKRVHAIGKRPNEIDVTSDGRYVYIPIRSECRYEVFDTAEEKVIAKIPVMGFPHNVVVSPDDRFMYLSAYDRGGRSVEEARQAGECTTLNKKIYVVDTANHKVAATIGTEEAPRPIAVSADGKRLYANTDNLMGFVALDLEERKLLHRVVYELSEDERATPSRSHGIGVTPDNKEVWSTNINHGFVHVFDVTQNPPKQIAKLKTGRTPLWLTMTPDGKTVYIANTADDTVSVFDAAAKKERTRIQLPKGKAPKRMLVLRVPQGAGTADGQL